MTYFGNIKANGNPIGDILGQDSRFHLTTTTTQNVIADPNNSSTNNLAGGATFTGVSTTTLGVVGLQVSLKTDQNCTVYVEQSPDNVNWDVSDSYDYNKTTNNFGVTVQAVSSYWRVRVTNLNTTTTTTYFRLQGILCPMVEALPRSLDSDGNLKVGIRGMQSADGQRLNINETGELGAYESIRIVGKSFGATADANFWTYTNSGAGSAAGVADAVATLASGTANSGYGLQQSTTNGRYIVGSPNRYRDLTRVSTIVVADCTRRWGAFTISGTTPQNGFYFELSPAGALSVNSVAAGVVNQINNGSFNGRMDTVVPDTNVHVYEISWVVGEVNFFIDHILLHTISATTDKLSDDHDLPCTAISENSASGTTNGTLELWATYIDRLGPLITASRYAHISGNAATYVLKTSGGTLQKIVFNNTSGTSLTIYDNTTASGTIIGIITTAAAAIGVWAYDVPFFTGLSIETAGNNLDATVVYE